MLKKTTATPTVQSNGAVKNRAYVELPTLKSVLAKSRPSRLSSPGAVGVRFSRPPAAKVLPDVDISSGSEASSPSADSSSGAEPEVPEPPKTRSRARAGTVGPEAAPSASSPAGGGGDGAGGEEANDKGPVRPTCPLPPSSSVTGHPVCDQCFPLGIDCEPLSDTARSCHNCSINKMRCSYVRWGAVNGGYVWQGKTALDKDYDGEGKFDSLLPQSVSMVRMGVVSSAELKAARERRAQLFNYEKTRREGRGSSTAKEGDVVVKKEKGTRASSSKAASGLGVAPARGGKRRHEAGISVDLQHDDAAETRGAAKRRRGDPRADLNRASNDQASSPDKSGFPGLGGDASCPDGAVPAVTTQMAHLNTMGWTAPSPPLDRLVPGSQRLTAFQRDPVDIREVSFVMAHFAYRALQEFRPLMVPFFETSYGLGYRRVYHYLRGIIEYHDAACRLFRRSEFLPHTRYTDLKRNTYNYGADSWSAADDVRYGVRLGVDGRRSPGWGPDDSASSAGGSASAGSSRSGN